MADDEIVARLLQIGLDDWLMAHDVVWHSTRGDLSTHGKETAIRVLTRLYDDGLAVPGDLGETGFEDWQLPADLWVQRSCTELERFDWYPMGAGFWLRLTDRGDQLARAETHHVD